MSEYKDPVKMLEMEMETRVDAYKIAYDEKLAQNTTLTERVGKLTKALEVIANKKVWAKDEDPHLIATQALADNKEK